MEESDEAVINQVVVAMSGGVDSSVAAALLVEQGYRVSGMMLRLWNRDNLDGHEGSTADNSLERARSVAQQLQIPFHEIDATTEFRKMVVDYFINSHQMGITPNPCFMCNRSIKWGLLLNAVAQCGGERLASGHYARIDRGVDGIYRLYKAKDILKDQSYVLAGLNQFQLSHAMFPLGSLTKREAREIAHRYNFPIKQHEESQDLCFLEGQSQEVFLKKYSPVLFIPGEIRTIDGRVIGEHSGLANYTIGQRKGIKLSHSDPYFVIKKDLASNSITVGTRENLGINRITITEVNWISGKAPVLPAAFTVKIRYKSGFFEAIISKPHDCGYDIIFKDIIRDPTPGQYAVFYDGDRVVGSGVITETQGGEET